MTNSILSDQQKLTYHLPGVERLVKSYSAAETIT
jgi:hypothetical protein